MIKGRRLIQGERQGTVYSSTMNLFFEAIKTPAATLVNFEMGPEGLRTTQSEGDSHDSIEFVAAIGFKKIVIVCALNYAIAVLNIISGLLPALI